MTTIELSRNRSKLKCTAWLQNLNGPFLKHKRCLTL